MWRIDLLGDLKTAGGWIKKIAGHESGVKMSSKHQEAAARVASIIDRCGGTEAIVARSAEIIYPITPSAIKSWHRYGVPVLFWELVLDLTNGSVTVNDLYDIHRVMRRRRLKPGKRARGVTESIPLISAIGT